MWVARWRESVIQPDGTVGRILRSETLGLVSEISSRREARVLLQDRLATLNSGQRRAEATMSFGDFVTQQIEPVVLPTLKPATQEVYSYLLQKHLLPRFRDCRLADITRAEVQQFLIGKLKAGYAWETTHHLRSLMSKIVGTAVDWNYLSVNAVRGAKMPERSLKRPHRFLSLEEVRRLLENSDEPVRTIVLLAVMTGLRIGEILALRWGRINLAAGTLRVEETCYKGTFGTPKTHASRRELPLSPAVVQALQAQHIRSRNSADDALVFAARQGTPLDAKNLRRRQLHSASQRAGLAFLTAHAWNIASRARNSVASGSSAARPFTHDDHAPDLHTCERKCSETGGGSLGILIVPKCSQVCRSQPTAESANHCKCRQIVGGRDRDRTGDPLLANTETPVGRSEAG
jgi:integrase